MNTISFKKWAIGVSSAFLALSLSAFFIFSVFIDPKGEWRAFETDFNRHKFLGGSLWQLLQKLNKKPYTLFFGSSRAHVFSTKIMGEPVLNFSSIYRNPADIYTFLTLLNEKEIQNINSIYCVLDYDGLFYEERIRSFTNRYDLLFDELCNLNFQKVYESYQCIQKNIKRDNSNVIDDEGNVVVKSARYLGTLQALSLHNRYVSDYCLDYLRKINEFCKTRGIKITFFTYSTPENTDNSQGYIAMMSHKILTAIDGFNYFLDLPELKGRRELFTDESHLTTEGAMLVAARLKDPSRPFYITAENNPWPSKAVSTPDLFQLKQICLRDKLSDAAQINLLTSLAYNRHVNPESLVKKLLQTTKLDYAGVLLLELHIAKRPYWLKFLLNRRGSFHYQIKSPPGIIYPDDNNVLCSLVHLKDWQARNILLFLKDKIDINDSGSTGITPLCMAIQYSREYLSELLLLVGADPNRPGRNGFPPLAYAIFNQSPEMTLSLIHI